ncbi:MAG TPA: AMP-binding protein [Casimicrobiaceae bacterium]
MITAPEPETIGSRLTAVAARLPGKVALTGEGFEATYQELDRAATNIAQRVATVGAERPGFVCLLFRSKVSAVKAMLGAARCGRAYISLDAADPDERLRFIIRDASPVAVLTEEAFVERARGLASPACEVIDVRAIASGREELTLPPVSPDATAYVVYTSGSTGAPKGVCQTQRNLLFFADAYAKALEVVAADRLSLLFSLSFGASNLNIFAGLFNGGTLCAYDMRRDGISKLADWLDREQVSVLHTVPTVFRELMASLAEGQTLASLRAIDVAGEALFDSDAELFRLHTAPHCMLVNQLGATEVSVIAQHRVERPAAAPSGRIVPVGRSPVGVRVFIRREDGAQAQANEIGEIVVCSPHVSPGYWRRPELNASTFSEDVSAPGSRCYLTRDLGRVDEAGNLHFLGRHGSRVKIRGHSVDLTEVEAALAACPGVHKAAVVAASDEVDKEAARLVAYLVLGPGVERRPLVIRRELRKFLPSYMLPSAFVFIGEMPLTSSGKIDRKVLAALRPPSSDGQSEPARDDVEETIAEIFGELLKRTTVGRDDDFFLLGGDSLSVVELRTRLSDAFGVSPSDFYDDATVSGIAADIRATRARSPIGSMSLPVLIPLRREGGKTPLFLIHGRLGQAFVSPHFLALLGDDQPVWAFQARGLDGLHEPHPTIEAMAADYLHEMRAQRPRGPYFIGALCVGAFVANVMARALRDAGEPVLPLLLFDPPDRPFQMNSRQVSEPGLLNRLRNKQATGRIAPRLDDPVYAKASVRTALALEHAVCAHKPLPYDGAVVIISSRMRMRSLGPLGLKALFTGEIEHVEIPGPHRQIIDVHNEVFSDHLKRFMTRIHAVATSSAVDSI